MFNEEYEFNRAAEQVQREYPIGFVEGPPVPEPPWPKGSKSCQWCGEPTYHPSGFCSRYCRVDAPAEVARLSGKDY